MAGRGGGAITAALALLLAGPAVEPARCRAAAEPPLAVACADGRLTLAARDVPAAAVYRALAAACGVDLRGGELLPDRAVTLSWEERPLEDALADLQRLTGVPSTLRAVAPGEPTLLVVLPTGAHAPAAPAGQGSPGAPGGEVRRTAAQPDPDALLRELEAVDGDAARVLRALPVADLLERRAEAAAESALRRCFAAATAEERAAALADLRALGPSPVTGEPWTEEDVADERWRLSWEGARGDYLVAPAGEERARALALLRELNAEEAAWLLSLGPAELERERRFEAAGRLRARYLLSRTPEEWERSFPGGR